MKRSRRRSRKQSGGRDKKASTPDRSDSSRESSKIDSKPVNMERAELVADLADIEVLKAATVFGAMIQGFDLEAPLLTRDPLKFFASNLENSLIDQKSGEASGASDKAGNPRVGARGQASLGDAGGNAGALGQQALTQRQHRLRLADAGGVHPNELPDRSRRASHSETFAQPRRVLLAGRGARSEHCPPDRGRQRRQRPVEAEDHSASPAGLAAAPRRGSPAAPSGRVATGRAANGSPSTSGGSRPSRTARRWSATAPASRS